MIFTFPERRDSLLSGQVRQELWQTPILPGGSCLCLQLQSDLGDI